MMLDTRDSSLKILETWKYIRATQEPLVHEPVPYTYFNFHGTEQSSPQGNIDHSAIQECRSKTRIVHFSRFIGKRAKLERVLARGDSGSFCFGITERALLIQHRERSRGSPPTSRNYSRVKSNARDK